MTNITEPDSFHGLDERGRWHYVDYDREQLVIHPDSDGEGLWVDKLGEGPVWVKNSERHLIAARFQRTVTTAEELDALSIGSVVLNERGNAWQKTGRNWYVAGSTGGSKTVPYLPATVLHVGG